MISGQGSASLSRRTSSTPSTSGSDRFTTDRVGPPLPEELLTARPDQGAARLVALGFEDFPRPLSRGRVVVHDEHTPAAFR